MKQIRLIIADDEQLIRGALVALLELEEDILVVGSADNGSDAVALAKELQPDVCLLDLEMPPSDGIYAAEEILAKVNTAVVIVTRHARPGVLRRALASRVAGFVPKSTPAEKLAMVIRDVAAGRRYVDPEIAAVALNAESCPLTSRELDVLRLSRAGETVQSMAKTLHLAPGTVRNYISSAMARLAVQTRFEAAKIAWEQGWI
ncbi:response regulator transcription factor [Psychromicrobium lacuslunae]|uniref:LuxR family transcriptional regulator n=1 Tax=Psychromicrobium lacuslunae TaxID=1618207 RepID=A0A0D4C2H9_9MICC|nr:response regulator transcription factor [Psychromicrobium lacuslunae]AJT42590.1 LuxR family transcriptional regulator [Psychromicrobium lacuslunae]